jgi:response regulator RpfG family c-di-GMP phosphodiesterase
MSQTIKILRVDDHLVELQMFTLFFGKDYEVLTASDGQEALHVLADHPDIKMVFADYHMPGMNGIEFIQEAKGCYPDISYYLMSAMSMENKEIRHALNSNLIIDFLQKPIKRNEILDVIKKTINLVFT